MDPLHTGYDLSAVESYNIEELRKQIHENSKALEESIRELKESNAGITAAYSKAK